MMWNNDTRRHEAIGWELDADWYVDSEGFLYMIPAQAVVDDIDGPDTEILDALNAACRDGSWYSDDKDDIAERLGLKSVDHRLKRFNPVDGFYHA